MSTIRFNTQFPGYEVLSELDRSNARILKARHLATGDLVAIKHFALNTDAETLRRFQRESAIMTSISHPNIVKIREVRLEAELPYIVMELIEGGNLRHLIARQGRLEVTVLMRMGLQMAGAFKAIHPQGIVHRDIKPENILYRPLPSGELHFLLTDFGVARLRDQSNTLTGQSLMTYEYASPEQFNDPKHVDTATDYYSLGVVLYECLTGSVPFALANHAGIVTFMNKVLTEAPPALTVTPPDPQVGPFAELLGALLQKNPAERLSDPDELTWLLKQAELTYLHAGRTGNPMRLTASRLTTPEPTAPEPKREEPVSKTPDLARPDAPDAVAVVTTINRKRPFSVGLTVAIGLLLVGGLGVYYVVSGSESAPTAGSPTSTGASLSGNALDASTQTGSVAEDTLARWQAQETERRRQERLTALAAGKTLNAVITDYRVGLFGGIKKVQIQLNNPSPVTFPAVAILVSYYKEKGGLYKTEKIFFTNVLPNSSPTRKAPDSDRGTRLSCKVLKYDLPESLNALPETLTTETAPTDSLNQPADANRQL